MAKVEFSIEDRQWHAIDFINLVTLSCTTTLKYLGIDDRFNISVLACNNKRISELNLVFRKLKEPTNVLSWPNKDRSAKNSGTIPEVPIFKKNFDTELGDLAFAYPYCAREAKAIGCPLSDHITHLTVHGTLHLLGFDHVSPGDIELMEKVEIRILNVLGLEDPYKWEYYKVQH
jgi:probable rRNA maturation factor